MAPVLNDGADTLMAVSGYVTAGMTDRHLKLLKDEGRAIALNVIVGMSRKDGIERAQHAAFNKIAAHGAFGSTMTCNYIVKSNPVHAKTYLWLKGTEPVAAFTGSANYTLTGFGRSQTEAMNSADPSAVFQFYNQCLQNTASCDATDIEDMVAIIETRSLKNNPQAIPGKEFVTLSLLGSCSGDTHARAGLNWGQREKRNSDQAYIPVPRNVQLSGFFPDRGEQFTVLTDDGESFIFVRAQENGKALHTTLDNSQLGEYIRARIGVGSGEYVTLQHLTEYGRTDIIFTKIDEETYILDFRPDFEPDEGAELRQE